MGIMTIWSFIVGATAAIELAAEADRWPELGPVHQVTKFLSPGDVTDTSGSNVSMEGPAGGVYGRHTLSIHRLSAGADYHHRRCA